MKNKPIMSQRQSGVELLRVILLFGVIMIHYYEVAHQSINSGINFELLYVLRSLSSSAVNTFIIISGFFMIKSYTRKPSKAITLILQVVILSEIEYLVEVMLGNEPLAIRHIVSSLVPRSYYTTLFVVLFIISPYINKLMNEMKIKDLHVFMWVNIIIFSIYSILTKVYSEIVHLDWFGINPIGAWGNQQGFNIVNFILLYTIGGYLRLSGLVEKITRKRIVIVFLVSTLVIILWSYLNRMFPKYGQISAWCYDNPIVLLQGSSLFVFFYKIKFYNKIINRFATAVYASFILHYYYLNNYAMVSSFCEKSVVIMIVHYILFGVFTLLIGWLFYEFYNYIFKKIYNRIDRKYLLFYFSGD